MTKLEETLNEAFYRCEGHALPIRTGRFFTIYPFTTERIPDYIDHFDLEGKSLLTVGSSGDQVINAALKGARDITLIDTNPYIRYYYYLKVAAILTLSRSQFYKFLCYFDYPIRYERNKNPLSRNLYEKVKPVLKDLDPESYQFWEALFSRYKPLIIRASVFNRDEHEPTVIGANNLYLREYKFYRKTREIIGKVQVSFENQDVMEAKIDRKFDNIWLSNICESLTEENKLRMFHSMEPLLEDGGSLLLGYIYGPENTNQRLALSQLNIMRDLFKKHRLNEFMFDGLNKQVHNVRARDCVMVYKKG